MILMGCEKSNYQTQYKGGDATLLGGASHSRGLKGLLLDW
jgi:hypothetical protein